MNFIGHRFNDVYIILQWVACLTCKLSVMGSTPDKRRQLFPGKT